MADVERSPCDSEQPAQTRGAGHSPHPSSLQVLGWCLVALFLVTSFVVVEGREPTWEDELYVLSTAWSMLHGGPPNQSALAIYPHSHSVVQFYGPVSFRAAVTLLRIFGLKTWPWRALCFLFGIAFIVLSSAFLLRLAGLKRWALLAGASAIAVSSAYCTSLPGRWDPMTVAFILGGMACLFYASDGPWGRLLWQSPASGILWGLAVGSTPRALPPLAAVGAGVAAFALIRADKRVGVLIAGIVASVFAVVTDAVLLAPLAMTPWSWLRFVRQVSMGDKINSSPFRGGEWGFQPQNYKGVIIFAVLILCTGFFAWAKSRRGQGTASHAWRVALTVAATANFVLTILLISRFLTYAIFWLPLLTVASFCWVDWELFPKSSRLRSLTTVLVGLALLVPTTLEIHRMVDSVKVWSSRDPRVLKSATLEFVPAGSIVLGPVEDYFLRVEQSGSRYLYLEDDILPGLSSGLDSPAYRQHTMDLAACTAPTFLLWVPDGPEYYPLPPEVAQYAKVQLSDGQPDPTEFPAVFRFEPPANCAGAAGQASAIKPFKALEPAFP